MATTTLNAGAPSTGHKGIEIDWRKFCQELPHRDNDNISFVEQLLIKISDRTDLHFAVGGKDEGSHITLLICPIDFGICFSFSWENDISHWIGKQRAFANGDFVHDEGRQRYDRATDVSYFVLSYFPETGRQIEVLITSDFSFEELFLANNFSILNQYGFRLV